MKNKIKGSNAERELLYILYNKGFAVSRVAGSGCSVLPTPDIIAIKNKKIIAIECKSKIGPYLNIKDSQIKELQLWEKLSKCKAYIAWRLKKNEWYFIHIDKLIKTKKAYSIKREDIKERGLILEKFIKVKVK